MDFDLNYLDICNEFSNEILYDNTLKWGSSNDTFGSKKELKLLFNLMEKNFTITFAILNSKWTMMVKSDY